MSERTLVRVSDIMDDNYALLDGLATVQDALLLMRERGPIPVIVDKRDDDDEYGIVVLSDISKEVLAKDRSPERVNVYEIMTKPLVPVSPNMNVRYCARLLERLSISGAPVMQQGKIVGMINYESLVLKGLLRMG